MVKFLGHKAKDDLEDLDSTADDEEQDEEQWTGNAQPVNSHDNDILKVLGITLQTEIDKKVLTTSEVAAVQFRTSTPKGYYFDDVDSWHQHVELSIEWFMQKIHDRDLDVYRLATEIDKNITDLTNARYETELLHAESRGVANPEKIAALEADIIVKAALISKLQSQLTESEYRHISTPAALLDPTIPVITGNLSDDERALFDKLKKYAEEVVPVYEELEKKLAASERYVKELEDYSTELETQLGGKTQSTTEKSTVSNTPDTSPQPVDTSTVDPINSPVVDIGPGDNWDQLTTTAPFIGGVRTPDEMMDDILKEIQSGQGGSELSGGSVPPESTSPRHIDASPQVVPGSPLTSIPEGEDVRDYL